MRTYRTALAVACTYLAALIVPLALAAPAASQRKAPPWKLSAHLATLPATTRPSPDDQQVIRQLHEFYTHLSLWIYVQAVQRAEQAQAAAAAAAASAAAEAQRQRASTLAAASTGPSSPPSTSTSGATSGGDIPPVGAASVWSCIISHESGGNPRAVNPSSGAGGLFQFLPSTWRALGFSGLPEDADVGTQVAAAVRAYDGSGWRPWVGDGCTPLG